jgi:GT2 family glycosyltransferase
VIRALVAIPTLSRADLLIRNKKFLEGIRSPDRAFILDNGRNQSIDINVPIERSSKNLGVAGSWNLFLRRAFVDGQFDLLVLLQDDIIWDANRLESAKRLVVQKSDVDLFLSDLQFSVQVHRPSNLKTIGFYDEQFGGGYCEDDEYAIRMTDLGRVYERFHELDPLPGSQTEGTPKSVPWSQQYEKLVAKWGTKTFGVNIPNAPWYRTNRKNK